jgi:transglutaminase-like putative cysteine protease
MNPLRPAAFFAAIFALLPFGARQAWADAASQEVWHRAVQVSTRLSADGLYDSTQTWDVTVDTASAARIAAQQGFGYSAGLEDVTVTEAYTLKPDGTRVPIGPDGIMTEAIGTSAEYPSFDDWQDRTIVFPDVAPGDTVHYVLHRQARAPLFPGQFETSLRAGDAANVTRADFSITLPAGMHLAAFPRGLDEAPPVPNPDGSVTRAWHLPQAGDTATDDDAGMVQLDLSTFPDYAALGDAYAARALPMAVPDAAVQALADRLTDGVTDREQQARLLYEHVARTIRYVGVQIGPGRVVPHDADTVMRNGFGDCKDHVVLLQALLAARGIFSEAALITVKPQYRLPKAPTLSILDHVVLFVPEFDVYLDSTSPYAPFGVLPFGDYGKPVVLTGPGGARVARVPPLPPDLAVATVDTEAQIEEDGSISGRTTTAAAGPSAIALREVASNIEYQGASDAAADQLRRLGTPGEGGFSFATPTELSDNYHLTGHFRLDEHVDDDDPRLTLPAGLTVLVRAGNFLVAPTAEPNGGHICYAGRQIENIRLHLPASDTVEDMPHDVAVDAGYASYHATYTRDGDSIIGHRELVVTAPHPMCSEAEYDAMHPALLAARRDSRAEVLLAAGGE